MICHDYKILCLWIFMSMNCLSMNCLSIIVCLCIVCLWIVCLWIVCLWIVCLWIVCLWNVECIFGRVYQLSCLWIVMSMICHVYELSVYEMPYRWNVAFQRWIYFSCILKHTLILVLLTYFLFINIRAIRNQIL